MAFNKMVYVVRDLSRPQTIYVRGARIDGPGTILFTGEHADERDRGKNVAGPAGTWTFYAAIVASATDAFYVYPSTPGCYALQIDGADFQEVIVLKAE